MHSRQIWVEFHTEKYSDPCMRRDSPQADKNPYACGEDLDNTLDVVDVMQHLCLNPFHAHVQTMVSKPRGPSAILIQDAGQEETHVRLAMCKLCSMSSWRIVSLTKRRTVLLRLSIYTIQKQRMPSLHLRSLWQLQHH